jgi:hypothetical protein
MIAHASCPWSAAMASRAELELGVAVMRRIYRAQTWAAGHVSARAEL